MKRSVGLKSETKIKIERDSEENVSNDDEYVPDETKAAANRKKQTAKPVSTDVNRKRKATPAQPKKTKPRSKIVKTLAVCDPDVEESDKKDSEENNEVLSVDKTNDKDTAKSRLLSMKRSLRVKSETKTIIECDSEEDVSNDDEYVPDETKAAANRKKQTAKHASTDVNRKRKATPAQPKKTEPRSKIVKTLAVCDPDVEESDKKDSEENNEVLSVDKTNDKDTAKSRLLSMKRSQRVKSETKTIIECDSEEEDVSSDDEYVPDETKATANRKKQTAKHASTDVNRKRKATPAQPKKTEPRSKIIKTLAVCDPDVEESDKKDSEENNEVLSVDKTNDKDAAKSRLLSKFDSVECKDWTDVDYVSEVNNVDKQIARNVVTLLKEDNTIPFIARYRRNMTGGMEADKLRAMKESLDLASTIKHKAATILKAIDKSGQWTPNIHAAIMSSKCLDDLEYIHSLFKTASTKSLAERAKKVGLESISNAVLQGQPIPDLSSLVEPHKEGLKTLTQVKDGIMHIIGDVINKNKVIFDKVREIQSQSIIKIRTTECKTSKSDAIEKDANRKYETYYNFNTNTRMIKPHQILAIYRGEAQKILTVKFILPDFFQNAFTSWCCKQYEDAMHASKYHRDIMYDCISYAFTKLIKPLVVRRVRNELKKQAETASIEVFAVNVKQLLLTSPVRGEIVLGIDPGFSHGCKLAVISEHGNVLDTGVIYPHKKGEKSMEESASILIKLINKHKCTLLALGNATACRETELFLNNLIKSKAVNISYAIVDESGASIYSCSAEAKSEFPDLDTNIVSAVSIARRLQDPLAELVKVEPKHLGVGMYQHDLPEKQLSATLNEVVSEAVSFVGVDVNTASQCLLKRVAGLNVSRANSIIQWRSEFGPFKNRKQVLEVKGIGNKTFEQCAGFIRILPETSMTDASVQSKGIKKYNPNLLDQTWIHPESYEIAERFVEYCKCNLEDLGSNSFIESVTSCAKLGCAALAQKFDTDETTMEIIVKGLSMKKDEDIRLKSNCPLFKNSMLSINDISSGTRLTGAVRNVTHFGAFVDVGVGRDGLIPLKWTKNCVLTIGQRVEVKVLTVDVDRSRISLELICAL